MSDSPFSDALTTALSDRRFVSLVLSRPLKSVTDAPRRQSVRPITLRGQPAFQWELQFARQQTHLNLNSEETGRRVAELFPSPYQEANLFTTTEDVTARVTTQGIRLQRRTPSRIAVDVAGHDRAKEYLIPAGIPCPFLIALDVMTSTGQVKQAKQKKFRQINRYLEIVNDIYPHLPATGPIEVLDFGCGLSYLTFAVHHLLTTIHHREVRLLGIDQNEQVISRCRQIAQDLSLSGLNFTTARIETLGRRTFDLAISLHACDTATDYALACAVQAQAKVILAAPCCQHELFTKLSVPNLEAVLQHGILKERTAALLTDGLRASALEEVGYRTQVLEFIDLEHTPKNLLIRAVRRAEPGSNQRESEYEQLKATLGVLQLATDSIVMAASSLGEMLDGDASQGDTASRAPG